MDIYNTTAAAHGSSPLWHNDAFPEQCQSHKHLIHLQIHILHQFLCYVSDCNEIGEKLSGSDFNQNEIPLLTMSSTVQPFHDD